jgi:hypothetical protein
MVDMVERIALKPYPIEDGEKKFEFQVGKAYSTSRAVNAHGEVFVMTRYWFHAPIDIFAPLESTVECPHCHKHFVTESK